jgi:hypothetical protein
VSKMDKICRKVAAKTRHTSNNIDKSDGGKMQGEGEKLALLLCTKLHPPPPPHPPLIERRKSKKKTRELTSTEF